MDFNTTWDELNKINNSEDKSLSTTDLKTKQEIQAAYNAFESSPKKTKLNLDILISKLQDIWETYIINRNLNFYFRIKVIDTPKQTLSKLSLLDIVNEPIKTLYEAEYYLNVNYVKHEKSKYFYYLFKDHIIEIFRTCKNTAKAAIREFELEQAAKPLPIKEPEPEIVTAPEPITTEQLNTLEDLKDKLVGLEIDFGTVETLEEVEAIASILGKAQRAVFAACKNNCKNIKLNFTTGQETYDYISISGFGDVKYGDVPGKREVFGTDAIKYIGNKNKTRCTIWNNWNNYKHLIKINAVDDYSNYTKDQANIYINQLNAILWISNNI